MQKLFRETRKYQNVNWECRMNAPNKIYFFNISLWLDLTLTLILIHLRLLCNVNSAVDHLRPAFNWYNLGNTNPKFKNLFFMLYEGWGWLHIGPRNEIN